MTNIRFSLLTLTVFICVYALTISDNTSICMRQHKHSN